MICSFGDSSGTQKIKCTFTRTGSLFYKQKTALKSTYRGFKYSVDAQRTLEELLTAGNKIKQIADEGETAPG